MVVAEIYHKRILFAVLGWGLGHATRSAPLIRQLVRQQNHVTVVSSGHALRYLQTCFPDLTCIDMPAGEIVYPRHRYTWLKLLAQQKKIFNNIKAEKNALEKVQSTIDLIISDNCYGFFHDQVYSILITHQVNIMAPFLQKTARKKIHRLLQPFHEIWIPDFEGEKNLAGELAHPALPAKACTYLGPLSGMENTEHDTAPTYEYCAIISGPEIQRTLFEKSVVDFIAQKKVPAIIIRGTTQPFTGPVPAQVKLVDLCSTAEVNAYINQSRVVIGRTGYSTIMDLHRLQKACMLLPTPGQTEQEYLFKRFFGNSAKTLGQLAPIRISPVKD